MSQEERQLSRPLDPRVWLSAVRLAALSGAWPALESLTGGGGVSGSGEG
jgi:hypothetical protein